MMAKIVRTKPRAKVILQDYATVLGQANYSPSLVCISATTKMLLLGLSDYIGWSTRYIGLPDDAIIEGWRENAVSELIGGMCLDDLCAQITDAINNCGDVKIAIENTIHGYDAGNGGGGAGTPGTALPVSEREKNLLPDGYVCTDDQRFATCVAIVQSIHEVVLQMFEAFSLATSNLDMLAAIWDNLPMLELIGIGLEIFVWLRDTLKTLYEASWTQSVSDEIACMLFCETVATGECYLSLQTIFNVYLSPTWGSPHPGFGDSADIWFEWVSDQIMSLPRDIVMLASLPGLVAMAYGGRFADFTLGVRSLETIIKLTVGDANNDWVALCEPCLPASGLGIVHFDSPHPLVDFPYNPKPMKYLEGNRAYRGASAHSGDYVFDCRLDKGWGITSAMVEIDLGANATVTGVSFWYKFTHPGGWVTRQIFLLNSARVELVGIGNESPTAQGTWVRELSAISATGVRYVRVYGFRFVSNLTLEIDTIDITGEFD
jgi:hypothetical protein